MPCPCIISKQMMIHWTKYKIKCYPTYTHKKQTYTDVICGFDTETTSLYNVCGQWVAQDYTDNPDIYSESDKHALVYIWQLAIDDDVVYGREIAEFFEFWDLFSAVNPHTTIVYVHNLGFDFEFLGEYMPADLKVFARKAYAPIYAKSEQMCIEFRCSYMLTNMSLATVSKQFALNVRKLTGDLIYNRVRTPQTELTEEELGYCENDVRIINALIRDVFLPRYGCIADIPLTQTGEVRRVVKKLLNSNKYHRYEMNKAKPDLHTYKLLTKVLTGGYTHANPFYTGDIVEQVQSFDKSSSYPDVMCTRKFPTGKFLKCDVKHSDKNYAYIVKVECKKIRASGAWCYLPRTRNVVVGKGIVNDNGKIAYADEVVLWLTDVDYDIFVNNYTIDEGGEIEVVEKYKSFKNYLPKPLIEFALHLYSDKTTLKGVDEQYAYYMRQKQLLNALFGMCITNNIKDEETYNPLTHRWEVVNTLTDSDIAEKLDEERPFLNFAWGVWITAYARHDLWELIHQIGVECLYCDTDSVKILSGDKWRCVVDEFNGRCAERIDRVCADLGLDKKLFYPYDIKGTCHPLGFFEYEKTYDRFLTIGSKKYCFEVNGKFEYTVAGLQKMAVDNNGNASPTMTGFAQMSDSAKIPNARKVHFHFWRDDNAPPVEVTDEQGHTYTATNHSGLCLLSTNYTFNVTDEEMQNFIFTARNKYRNPFRFMERGL